jgi:fibronectin-binding autotransporter adhesin
MGTGYTRQSSSEIIDGEVGDASDFNNEFDAIESAFDGTTGHSHDGTTGEGPIITVIGGGTGVATLTDGGILLGSGTGAVTALAAMADGEMVVGDGTTDPVLESGTTLRTSIGVGTGDSPQFTGVELGHATDTTITRSSAGVLAVEGNVIYAASGTDVPVADGGTGASTLTDGGVLLGSGTGAITAMAVLTDGQMIVGDGTTDPVAESGATLRTSVGVGTGDSPQFTGIELGHATDTTITRTGAGAIAVEGNQVYLAGGTDVPVADGGTGASTLTDGGILLGSGTGAVTAMAVLADGAIAIGDGTTDPVAYSAFSSSTGTLNVAAGGSGLASFTAGDLLYATGTTTLAKLAKGTASQTLKMNSGATAPEWVTVAENDGGVAMAIALG